MCDIKSSPARPLTAVVVLALAFYCALCFAQQEEPDVLLGDFETNDAVGDWQMDASPRGDCRLVQLSRSEEHASHGKASLRVTYPAQRKGAPPYVILEPSIDNRALTVTDWSPYDRFSADVFSPAADTVRITSTFRDVHRKKRFMKYRIVLEQGWTRVQWSVHALREAGMDVAQVAEWTLFVTRPEDDIVIFLDNVRLQRTAQEQRVLLGRHAQQLRQAAEALSETAGEVHTMAEDLQNQLDPDTQREANGEEPAPTDITEALRPKLDALVQQLADTATDAGRRIALPAPAAVLSLRFVPGSEVVATDAGSRSAARLVRLITEDVQRADLQRRLDDHAPGADLAVGHVVDPFTANLPYRPQTFDGPLVNTIAIAAARSEVEPFCIMLLPRRDLSEVKVTLDGLVQVNGPGSIGPEQIEVAPLGYRQEAPDTPARARILRPDIDTFDIPGDAQQAVWINVRVPVDAPAGRYVGTLRVTADHGQPSEIEIELTVWPFAIPTVPTFPVVTHYAEDAQADDLVMAHRVNASTIYRWPDVPELSTIRRRLDGGTQMHTLFRISRMHRRYQRDTQGRITRFEATIREGYLKRLRARVPELREAGVLDRCYAYGFDEPTPGMVPALEDMFGAIKQEFGVATFFTTYLPIWEEHPVIEHVDHYGVTWSWLTPERLDAIRAQDSLPWAYNLATTGIESRTQFWAAFKSNLHGLLHYSLHAGGGASPAPGFPVEPGAAGGVCFRIEKDSPAFATVAFEHWREGLEDIEYLTLLRSLTNRLAAEVGADGAHRYALQEARRWLDVPESIAPRAHEFRRGAPVDLARVMQARAEIAALIVQFQEALGLEDQHGSRTTGKILASVSVQGPEVTDDTTLQLPYYREANTGASPAIHLNDRLRNLVSWGLIRFDLESVKGQTIEGARLKLYYSGARRKDTGGDGRITITLHRIVSGPWKEGNGTGFSTDTGTAGASALHPDKAHPEALWPGGAFDAVETNRPLNYDPRELGHLTLFAEAPYARPGWRTFSSPELTEIIRAMAEGTLPNHGFLLKAGKAWSDNTDYELVSSNDSNQPSLQPVLELDLRNEP